MLLEGLDPNQYGYEFSEETAQEFRHSLIEGQWKFIEDQEFMWTDIQNHIPLDAESNIPGAIEYIEWLREVDVAKLRRISEKRQRPEFRYRVAPHLKRILPIQAFYFLKWINKRVPV